MSKKQYSVRTAAVAATERRARRSGVAVAASGSGSSNYIDIAGDVAGKLDREVFDSMFERVVTGVDDEGNETWYIKAKATLVSVRDVVAYGASDIIGGGGGSSTGGLDEEQLAAYLTANNYITQADLGNYVTVDGGQTITGGKRFAATDTNFTKRITVNGTFEDTIDNFPQVMWHVSNRQWTKVVMDTVGSLHIMDGGAGMFEGAHHGIVASQFVKHGGTASQFLKADGSVDDTQYLYHRRTAEGFNIDSIDALGGGLYEVPLSAGTQLPNINDWHKVFDWGANDNGYRVQMATALTRDGSMFFRHKIANNWYGWREILDSVNYQAYLDQRYVNKAGDTMTGGLIVDGDESHFTVKGATYTDPLSGVPCAIKATGKIATTDYVKAAYFTAANTTLCTNLNADLLDGLHAGSFIQQLGIGQQTDTHGAYVVLCPAYSGAVTNGGYFYGSVTITRGSAWSYNAKSEIRVQCGGQYNSNQGGYQNLYNNVGIGGLYVITYNGTSYIALYMQPSSTMDFWVSGRWSGVTPFLIDAAASGLSVGAAIATTPHINSNALSATKLQTARTIYINSYNGYRVGDGVAFDGTGDITLKLPNSLTASDWFRSYGATGWYNETYGGGIYMSDTTWIRTWQQKSFYTGSGEIRSDSEFNRMGYGGSSWDNGYGAYNVAIYNNANQTPLLLAYRDGAGVAATGANRLFAIELLNNGAMLNFGFGGGARFYFYSSGTLVATGDVTAYSDMRLKSDIRTLTNRGFITPRTYIKDGRRCIGFLAQEVQQRYPELVMDTGGADHWLSLNYGNLVAVLEAQIIDHEDRIKRLEERI